jgi:hypothetical protein
MIANTLASVTDPTGHKTQITYPPIMGQNGAVFQDANNHTTTYGFTSGGQPRAVVNALALSSLPKSLPRKTDKSVEECPLPC